MIDPAEAGIVLGEADLNRFAHTFLDAMWNGSVAHPTAGGYVNTKRRTWQSGNLQDWLRLSRVEPKIQQVCVRIIPNPGSLKAKGQLLRLPAARGMNPRLERRVSGRRH